MIGNAEHVGLFGRRQLRRPTQRFFAVDGGAGAHIIAKLAHLKPALRRVASPRHADLLLVVSPLSAKMREPLVEIALAMAKPSRAIVIESGCAIGQAVDTDALLRHAEHVSSASSESILRHCSNAAIPAFEVGAAREWNPDTLDLPSAPTELETARLVSSLGPVQRCTAGPLRMLLVCDGEQVVRAELQAGYAFRGVAEAMTAATWKEAEEIAAALDPLAPFTGRLAYVRAVESLQHRAPDADAEKSRDAALAFERARNGLWWFVRFAELLDMPEMTGRAHAIATRLDACIAPFKGDRQTPRDLRVGSRPDPAPLARDVESLASHVIRDRPIGLRCKGIGVLALDDARRQGISGPSLAASRSGNGDVRARLAARLAAACADLRNAATAKLGVGASLSVKAPVSAGSINVTVEGPRGTIGLSLRSDGGKGPVHVEWRRPSAAVLKVLPDLLKGQKMADAMVTVASFDIATAEADG